MPRGVLVAIVDAQVGIAVPEQDRVDAPESPLEVVEQPVDRVCPSDRIVERAVMDHEDVLDERALRPRQLRTRVLAVVMAGADQALAPPVAHVGQPRRGRARVPWAGNLPAQRQEPGFATELGTGHALPERRVLRVLRHGQRRARRGYDHYPPNRMHRELPGVVAPRGS